nr:non-ribosomal peptide synthetase [Paenibacillus thiaminolyticus]
MFPLTHAQQRIWYTELLYPNTTTCMLSATITIRGTINRELLEQAIQLVIQQNEAFRIKITQKNSEAMQYVDPYVHKPIDFLDFSEYDESHVDEWLNLHNRMPIKLLHSDLYQFVILKINDEEYRYSFKVHHIVSDGISMNLAINQITENYVRLTEGTLSAGDEKQPYTDYIDTEQDYGKSERCQKDKAYWLEKFQSLPEITGMKSYNPLVTSTAAKRKSLTISSALYHKLMAFSRENKISVFIFFLSAMYIYLHKASNQNDITIGSVYANRTTKKEKDTVGMFASTVAGRMSVESELDLLSFLQRVAKEQKTILRHQKYPYNQLIQDLREKHNNKDIQRLFGIAVEYQAIRFLDFDNFSVRTKVEFGGHEGNDCVLHIKEMSNDQQLVLDVHYRTHIFEENEIQQMLEQIIMIAEHMIHRPFKKIVEVSLISEEEKNTILNVFNDTWADYPRGKTIHQLVEEQAERTPDRAAVVCEGSQLTYRELNTKANQLARTLRAEGVRPDQPVGLLAERSLEMIVGILAIMKAGGAYVPMDPEYPEERIGYMLEDSGAKLLLTQSHLQKCESFDGKRLMLDDEQMYSEAGSNLEPMAGPDSLAYVIYTSGTTGKPKGVMVEHRGLCNLKPLFEDTLHIGEQDHVVQFASLSFDASCWEMFKALFTGATLYIPAKETILDPRLFEDYMSRHRITAALLPPTYAAALTPGNLPSLKKLITGGSASSVELVQQWQDRVLYFNAYGPTEDSIVTTIWPATTVALSGNPVATAGNPVALDGKLVPIGRPLPNHRVYIVGANDQLLPIGIPGELCISGAGVARGYLNRPELTEERFVDNPFEPGTRMYRTGDLAKWLPDGNIEYLGRIDHQVKIRGYRIELGEVEAQLLKTASVQEAVAIAREDGDRQPYLCAYIVADKELTSGELRNALSQALPGYMVPSCFVQLEHMPLTPNGKIDRKALPEPDGSMHTGADYVAPRTAVEGQLAQIWQEVLGLPRIGVKDHFFDIGGHSLRATALVAKLHKEMGIEMPLREVFQYPTIEQMAEVITGKEDHAAYRSIPITEESAYYPLSSAQKRLYILSQMEGGELSYNMPGVLEMEGALDRERLEEAFRQLIRHHETLRTGFELFGGAAVQRVHQDVEFAVEHVRVKEEEANAHLREFMRPFDLRQPPLLRARLLELEPERHLLLFDMHHIISDGASMGLFLREFAQLYEGAELPPLRIQYKDYAAWQQGEMQRERMRKQEAYWLEVFGGEIPVLDLPADYIRPLVRSFEGNTFHFVIDQPRSEKVRQLALQTGTTLYMVLLAAYTTLLSKYSGQEDIIVGTPIAGRAHADLEPLVGMFVNTLAMRNAPSGEKTFQEYLQEVKEHTLSAYENQDYPFEELVSKLDVSRDMSRNPIFDTMFVLQNIEQSEVSLEGLTCKLYPNDHHIAKFDLTFSLTEEAEGIAGSIEYACSLYEEETIERMAGHFKQVLDTILSDPNRKLSSIEIISPEEKAQILETFNDTAADYPRDKTIHQLVEEQAERTPDRAAVVYEGSQLTYRELNTKANQLARTLRAEGVRPDQPVGLLAERSLEMIVGMLAIMKAGGAYVPMDPEYPEERIGYMLEDSGAKLLLTQSHLQKCESFDGKCLMLDDERMYSEAGSNLEPMSGPDSLAYVIYTSGTTGKPKGVMVEHRGLCNLKPLFDDTLHIGEQDHVVQFASLSFDASCWEMFKAFFTGATLYIPAKETILDPRLFEDYMSRHRITAALLPPTYAAALTPGNLPSLKKLITGGSASSVDLVQQWQDRVLYFNAYGPTEDSIVTTIWPATTVADAGNAAAGNAVATAGNAVAPVGNVIAPDGKLVSIGRPIPNHRVYIVGANDQLLPVGIPGELCISGAGVARGYLNRPELTGERFVDNPFEPGARMYRTGDLAKWLPDGTIEYLGRIDHQVKIRGYRIELGEVEAQLLKIASVQEAVAIAREDGDGQPYLCAYIVADKEMTAGELRSALSQELPGYMVPSCFVQLEHLPLTPNGKIDRKALPAPDGSMHTGADDVAPRTAVEAQLAQIWQEVLGLPRIGVKDHFFDIGGHSLRATTLVAKLHKEMGIEMPLREVFQYPTIEQMAEVITGKEDHAAYRSIPITEESAYYPLSSAQKRLYILSQMEGGELSYNMPGVLEMEGALDRERLEEAFRQLIRRHEALRTGFELVGGAAVQRVHRDVEFAVEHVRVKEEEANAHLRGFMRLFDLREPPLLRARLLELEPDRYLLLFDMHHIISDGASMGLFLQELAQLYEGAELPPLRIQYKDYAAWQQGEMQRERMSKQEAYWLEVFGGELPVLDLPADYARPGVRSFTGNTFRFVIDKQRSENLRQLALHTGTTLYMIVLAAYTTLLSKYSGQEDIIVGTPVAGRTHADLEPLVGMFVNTLAMRNAPSGEKTFREYVQEVKEHTLSAYENQDYPFEELVSKLDVSRDMSRNPLFDTMFVLQNIEQSEVSIDGLTCKVYPNEHHIAKFDLTFSLTEEAEGIAGSIEYARSLFKEETIERMAGHFKQVIDTILSDPNRKLSSIEIISPEEKAQILETFNDTAADYPRDKTIHQLVEEQAGRTPDQAAVVYEGSQLTYRELNTKANQLARTLRAEGVRPDQPVGLLAERSLEMIVGILAIMKAGGAYVPMDPEYPEERIGYMLTDSGAKLLLSQSHLQKCVSFDGKCLMLDDERMYSEAGSNLEPMAGPDSLAYVIYTSGTTGRPKGVMVEHRGLCNLKPLFEDTLHIGEQDHVVQFASLSFDASCWEIFKAFFTGATLYIPTKETIFDPRLFEDYMSRHCITAALLPPTYAAALTPGNLPSLKKLITGGSASSVDLVRQWQDSVLYFNAYGPTEDSIVTTIWPATTVAAAGNTAVGNPIATAGNAAAPVGSVMAPAGKLVSIGRPIQNHRVYIVDANDQLLPVGIPGELCISGAGVARGYLNRPKLTEERFVDNPFEPGERMYRTGDLAKWLPDGNIEYLGRIDHQVKIRGYRIELGEVEAQLLKIASVQEAVALAREDGDGQPYLCAYIVADKELTSGELKSALSQKLPGYMVPSCFVQLEYMPLTPNRKIDRKALPAPDGSMHTGADYVAPRTAVEGQLAQIWQEVLGLPRIGVKDHFFDIGGHSLRATTLVAKLHKEMGIEMPLREVFQYPTIEQMAEVITGKAITDKERQVAYRPIPITEESAYYPLSSAQKRLYILSQLEGGELSYNMPGILEMEGALDRERLEEAFRQLIRRHESLRTGFELVGGEAVQRVHRDVEFAVEYVRVKEEEANAHLRGFMRLFDLREPPLLRARLLELEPDRYLLLFDMHHIISDGASMGLFLQELAQLYEGAELPPLRIQYKDYAAWQQGEMQRERMRKQEAYWLEVFGGDNPVLDLPADYARPLVRSFRGNTFHFVIDQQRSEKVRQLALQTGTTLYMVLLAVYTTLLSKYSGQEDIIVGTPIAGRTHADLEPLVGMFVNTLAIRNAPSGEKTFQEYVQEVKENTLSAYENQDYPFEELVSKLDVSRDMSRNPLFDTAFVLQNTEQSEVSIEGLACKLYPNEHDIAKFDLTFSLTEEAEGIAGSIEYACSLYEEETIERMAGHFKQVLDTILSDPNRKLSSIEIISPEEKAQILETFNDTSADYPRDKTIHQLVEEQAERTPDRAAVVYEGSQLTYRELNTKANRLARTLRAEGVRPDQPVGLLAERSLEMIVGMLAIMKAGGAYVPMDPEYPEERIGYMLTDSRAKLLLSQSHLQKCESFEGKRLMLDDERMYSEAGSNLEPMSGPDSLAYVIYTSGTTGKPKGVMVEHRGLCNLKPLFEDTLHIGEQDHVVQFASLSFDASCWEMFKALFTGATLYIPAKKTILDPRLFEDYMSRHRITAALLPPTYAAALTPGNLPSLKKLITGGSASSVDLVQQWQDRVLYFNAYGPTEDSIVTTIWPATTVAAAGNAAAGNAVATAGNAVAPVGNVIAPAGKLVPIGRPLPNHRVYIVGTNDQLLPVGIAGELCISGAGVARGYLNRRELTEERFVDNPFEPGARMYRTGDLAKWLPDGNIEYLGRIDHQVKIRGYRIELGEVEAQLLKITSVQEAVAIAREDGDGQPYLCAYIVADKELTAGELRSALSQALPGYMVPSCFVQLEHMPVTPNGKIDRKALPAPDGSMQTGANFVAPRTAMEAQLAQIWQEVLGLSHIGVKDNFFDIGGHSLKVLQLIQKIHAEMEMDISLRVVFEMPTIEEMAIELLHRKFNKFEQQNGSNIIKLNKNGLMNVFCFPPALGYGIAFSEMAKHLEDHCVIYAIEFIEGNYAHTDMLDQYVDSIISIQEKGPYVFLGYSAGGNLAFEVAKAMEKRGYKVSDIIMVDSMKRKSRKEESPEEIDHQITQLLEVVPEHFKQVLNAPVTREKVRNKMRAYHMYWNELVNTGVVQANIYGLVAESSTIREAENHDVLLWKQATSKCYVEYELYGQHMEVLVPGFVEENAKVIQRIINEIFETTHFVYRF